MIHLDHILPGTFAALLLACGPLTLRASIKPRRKAKIRLKDAWRTAWTAS
ncbi:MAG TPA: hypothetical protein PLH93_09740 [Flavobacteriales bacterium]|nr:hypothetical protein [Flavobacteriales bacterium]